jgi:hypothetical protein
MFIEFVCLFAFLSEDLYILVIGGDASREFKVSTGVWCLLDQIYFLEKYLIKKLSILI